MKVILPLILATAVAFSTPVAAQEKITITRDEASTILAMLFGKGAKDEFHDCDSDSDCSDGWVCVGIGLCVPPAAKDMQSRLPSLLKF